MDVHIRPYRHSDLRCVREIYAAGVHEHFPRARQHILHQPWALPCLVLLAGLPLCLPASLVLRMVLSALVLAVCHLGLASLWSSIIQRNLREDLLDIGRSYMMNEGACFWVAECEGKVVGTVGICPSEENPSHLELKRMNVVMGYRGRGIAKALCRTVLHFAQDRDCPDVVLRTSVIQTEAQALYHKMGFRLVGTTVPPYLLARLTNYTIQRYHYTVAHH
ncbi:probable N-acetyltransferase camello [Narcine bancroftii]|uniref:probable N-acetyltransferase camello n=1 Tax=Narcine bancroftii TaxID=1343680 RepID=UPI003830FFD0